jgi:hypothetical protein
MTSLKTDHLDNELKEFIQWLERVSPELAQQATVLLCELQVHRNWFLFLEKNARRTP